MGPCVLSVENAAKSYGSTVALQGASLELHEGELLGPTRFADILARGEITHLAVLHNGRRLELPDQEGHLLMHVRIAPQVCADIGPEAAEAFPG